MGARDRNGTRSGARVFVVDTVFVFVAQLLGKLRGLLTMPLLIKGLGTDAYGTWSQILAFTVLVTAIVGLNLHHSLIRFVAAHPGDARRAYGGTWSMSLLASATVCLLLGMTATSTVVEAFVGTSDRVVFWLALGVVVTTTLKNINLNLYRALERVRVRSVIDFCSAMVELGLILAILHLGRGLREVLLAMVIVGAVVVTATTIHARGMVGFSTPSREMVVSSLRYGIPLIPAGVSMWILDRADRFLLSQFLDQTAVGIYSAHCVIGGLILYFQVPLQMTLVPKVMQLWEKDRSSAETYLALSFRIFAILAMFFAATIPSLAPSLFRLLANETIARGSSLNVLLIAVGTSFWGLAVVETCVLYAANRTRTIGALTMGCAAVNIGVNVLLIPRLGVTGAAIGTVVAYGLTWAAYALAGAQTAAVQRGGASLLRAAVAAVPVALGVWLIRADSVLGLIFTPVVAAMAFVVLLVATGAITSAERALVTSWLRARIERGRSAA